MVNENWFGNGSLESLVCNFTNAVKKWSRETYGHVIAKKRRILARLQGIQKALERFYFKKSDKGGKGSLD